MMAYQEFEALPDWAAMQIVDGKHVGEAGKPKWSGKLDPPKIGEKVAINFNGLGSAVVVGYFEQDGYLGLLVKLDNPPEWYLKQNKGNAPGHVFGAEIN